jgi:acetoin:2,6-dichlorophenolindophenol oxidoreductase subunit alpha
MTLEKDKLLWMYNIMVRHRAFEDRVLKHFETGDIPGFVHLGQGEEAIGVGALSAIRSDDTFTSTHRTGHGHLLARGETMNRMMAELFGKKTGMMKGKSGCMHFANLDLGELSCTGILGNNIGIATGMALAHKMQKTDRVALCFFGDGTSNTGAFHENVNMASAWKLPVVYIIENNQYAESTAIRDATNVERLSDRALAYNIPGVHVDGNDPVAVYEAVSQAVARARKGQGPSLIECETCRQRGHFEGDEVSTYRTTRQIDECKKRDPIPRFRKKLIENGLLTDAEADRISREAEKEVDRAVVFAQESPFPDLSEVTTDVYV